jgi:F-type H+-transporting ATPase subunit epsilon
MSELTLEIRTPEKSLFLGKVESFTADAVDGEIGVLPDHTPLATCLKKGAVSFNNDKGEKIKIDVPGGFLIINKNQATVLTPYACGSADSLFGHIRQ